MEYEQIEAMVAVLRDSPRVTELEVRQGQTTVRLRRPAPSRGKKTEKPAREKAASAGSGSAAKASPAASGKTAAPSGGPKRTLVAASRVGVFRPLHASALSAGDSVQEGQILGHIEAMRLMNDVTASGAGRIEAVFVQEGQPVEFGQPLFEIVPEAPA